MDHDPDDLRSEEARLLAQLAKVRQAMTADEAEKAAVVGDAVLREAKADPVFRAKLHAVLEKQVKPRRHRELVGLQDEDGLDHRRTGD
ncbi:hypothetical protein [Jannaschia rubra]|uniref:Uncharacterized protein n=1 Tax=Jannaschia rubra TaxID=282197 RepID=A0A0M6XV93_9RHOB|nr:hypothetical protein [Jannaschia rubra]CTQ34698.1 hypothetical protein JAN5088_03494 [Jannaschia rubra]SFG64783.1 hypothetical protein SAMN04488517_10940 [Jannaschia rubra]